jgi:hypothetical protein
MAFRTFARAASFALVGLGLIATQAAAIVTFDPTTGTGFVGKGDVQTAFGWNNAKMQREHEEIKFKYVASTTYAFDCEWYTGPDRNRTRHENTKTAATNVDAKIASESRKTGQWTGWNLRGYAGGAPNQPAEPTDADCGAEGNEMKTIVPGSVEVSASTGRLLAIHPPSSEREVIYTTP